MTIPIGLLYGLVFCVALAVSLLLIPLGKFLSRKYHIMSQPGGRRREAEPMPKLGSIALFGGFTVAVLLAQGLPIPRFDAYEMIRLTGLLLGGTLIFVVGLLDDLYELNFFWQAMGQIAAASIAITFQIFIEYFNNPLTGQPTDTWSPLVTVTLTLLWLGLMMNTVNFLDGVDGLASGVAIIAGILLFVNSVFFLEPQQWSVAVLPLALVGACLGFWIHNMYPAQIIMGGGALYLGFLLGALSIIGGAKMATILLVMGLPLMDLVWQAVNRLSKGRNPFEGDRGHLHFRLQDTGIMTPRQIALTYYVFCAFFGGLTLVLESQLYKFVAFAVMLAITIIGFFVLARLQSSLSTDALLASNVAASASTVASPTLPSPDAPFSASSVASPAPSADTAASSPAEE